jgi:hypothetical protein
MTLDAIADGLGARADGVLLFIGGDGSQISDCPFVRVRMSADMLLSIGSLQRGCGSEAIGDGHQTCSTMPQAPGERHLLSQLPVDTMWSWSIVARIRAGEALFWLEGTQDDRQVGTKPEVVFRSIAMSPDALLQHLRMQKAGRLASEPAARAPAAFVRDIGPFVLLSGTDESFVDVVTDRVPEVLAALTAIDMSALVSKSLSAAEGSEVTNAAAPRRRRLGV